MKWSESIKRSNGPSRGSITLRHCSPNGSRVPLGRAERRFLVEDLVDSVRFYPDRLTVQVASALPFLVTLEEVGLPAGSEPLVSEARRDSTRRAFGFHNVNALIALARLTLSGQRPKLPT
jgi:hypothetical protein